MPTGRWFTSDSGVRWFFDAGAISLDFAYLGGFPAGSFGPGAGVPGTSRPQAPGAAAWDGLLVPADLDDAVAGLSDSAITPAGERELVDARALRDAIARLALCAADGHLPEPEDIDAVNLVAALPDIPPSLGGGRRQAGAGRLRAGQALASIARDAVLLFGEAGFVGDPGSRIRRCAASDCGLVFADESRAGSRRWCSMATCGNRAKVRAHRARARRPIDS